MQVWGQARSASQDQVWWWLSQKDKAQKSPGRFIVASQPTGWRPDQCSPWLGTATTCSRTRDRHTSNITEIGVPGLSLNEAPKPMGRGCGWRSQWRLVKVIKAHYWPQDPVTETQMILQSGSRWSCWGSRKTVTWFGSKISKGTVVWMKTYHIFLILSNTEKCTFFPSCTSFTGTSMSIEHATSLFCKGHTMHKILGVASL